MILITGASSGIGLATAEIFAQQKRNLYLLARREDRLAQVAKDLSARFGVTVLFHPLDISDAKAVDSWYQKNKQQLLQIEVLVNNAGLALGSGPFQEGRPEDWEIVLQTNVMGLLRMSRLVVGPMIENRKGHIVNLGSVAGHYTYPNGTVYCASKFAVKALNEGMRLDLNGTGIRVTAISPGMVETEFSLVRFGDPEKAKKVYQGLQPLTAGDIAETIAWAVNRPAHVNIQDIVIYPTDQASPTVVTRRP
jgi:NADP-dependent 3-hydroxy acid dehydrogenase YdfG